MMADKKLKEQTSQPAGERKCPGEKYAISVPICKGRQRNKYPKCLLCPFRDDTAATRMDADPRIDPKVIRESAVRGRHPVEMNPYVGRKMGLAMGQFIRAENPSASVIAVGQDAWPHAPEIALAIITGVADSGLDVVDLGLVSRDMLVFEMGTEEYDGAVFVTGASCMSDEVAIQMFRGDATPMGLQNGLESVSHIARRPQSSRSGMAGRTHKRDIYEAYRSYVAKFALHVQPVKCVVDASFGMGSRVLPLIAEELPLDLVTVNFGEADLEVLRGRESDVFPDTDALHNVRNAVASSSAQFGVIFDHQMSRAAFLDDTGSLLRPGHVGVLLARELLRRSTGGTVLYDQRTSAVLREEVKIAGGRPLRSPADYLCMRLTMVHKDALMGVDAEGRFFFREFFHADSPLIAMLLLCSVLSAQNQPLSELMAPVRKYTHSGELRLPVKSGEKAEAVVDAIRGTYSDGKADDLDGWTVAYHDWWMNVRLATGRTEVLVNIEARDPDQTRAVTEKVTELAQRIGN